MPGSLVDKFKPGSYVDAVSELAQIHDVKMDGRDIVITLTFARNAWREATDTLRFTKEEAKLFRLAEWKEIAAAEYAAEAEEIASNQGSKHE